MFIISLNLFDASAKASGDLALPEYSGSPVPNHMQRAALGSVVVRGYW